MRATEDQIDVLNAEITRLRAELERLTAALAEREPPPQEGGE